MTNSQIDNFVNLVVDLVAQSRSWAQWASWGCSLTEISFNGSSWIIFKEQ